MGERPDSDEATAAESMRRHADRSPQLTAYVETLRQRWPEHDDLDEEHPATGWWRTTRKSVV